MLQERPLFAAPSRRLLSRAGRSRRDERIWRDAQPHLLRLARRAVADPDVEAVAAAGAQLARGLLEIDLIGVRELARDGQTLLARAAVGPWPDEYPRPERLDLESAPLIALASVCLTSRTTNYIVVPLACMTLMSLNVTSQWLVRAISPTTPFEALSVSAVFALVFAALLLTLTMRKQGQMIRPLLGRP